MAVIQTNTHKVRYVMDFRELNIYVDTFTATEKFARKKKKKRQLETAGYELIHSGRQ